MMNLNRRRHAKHFFIYNNRFISEFNWGNHTKQKRASSMKFKVLRSTFSTIPPAPLIICSVELIYARVISTGTVVVNGLSIISIVDFPLVLIVSHSHYFVLELAFVAQSALFYCLACFRLHRCQREQPLNVLNLRPLVVLVLWNTSVQIIVKSFNQVPLNMNIYTVSLVFSR